MHFINLYFSLKPMMMLIAFSTIFLLYFYYYLFVFVYFVRQIEKKKFKIYKKNFNMKLAQLEKLAKQANKQNSEIIVVRLFYLIVSIYQITNKLSRFSFKFREIRWLFIKISFNLYGVYAVFQFQILHTLFYVYVYTFWVVSSRSFVFHGKKF